MASGNGVSRWRPNISGYDSAGIMEISCQWSSVEKQRPIWQQGWTSSVFQELTDVWPDLIFVLKVAIAQYVFPTKIYLRSGKYRTRPSGWGTDTQPTYMRTIKGVDGNCQCRFSRSHLLSDMVERQYFDVFVCFPCNFCTSDSNKFLVKWIGIQCY